MFTLFDGIFFTLILLFTAYGAYKGLANTFSWFIKFLLPLYVAWVIRSWLGVFLADYLISTALSNFIAFLILFLVFWTIIDLLLKRWITRLLSGIFGIRLNRILGGIFGALSGFFVISLCFMMLGIFAKESEIKSDVASSLSYPMVRGLNDWLLDGSPWYYTLQGFFQ